MTIELKDLQYYLMPGENVADLHLAAYEETYRVWKDVWSSTFRELDGDGTIYADHFSRQEHMAAIFYRKECVAMCAMHPVDFRRSTAKEDSYFKPWPEIALKALTSEGPKVMICSYLTVNANYRGKIVGNLGFKNLLGDLVIRDLIETDCDAMTGTMRNNRGANTLAYENGATPILTNQNLHGVDVDLVCWYRRTCEKTAVYNAPEWAKTLWESRIDARPNGAGQTQQVPRKRTA